VREVEDGNQRYQAGDYAEAEKRYREAEKRLPGMAGVHFDLGAALHRQAQAAPEGPQRDALFDSAEKELRMALDAGDAKLRSSAHYNLGNTLYERGKFTYADTLATASALRFYAPGLIGYSVVKIASPTFYSLGTSRTPVMVSVASVMLNLVLNILLVQVMGFKGLALGTAVAAMFNAGTLLWLLRRRLGGLEGRRVTIAFVKITAAALVMGMAAALAAARLDTVMPGSGEVMRGLRVAIAIGAALVALVVSARLLRIEEFTQATERVLRRVLPARR